MIRHSLLAFFTLGLIVLSVRRWYWGLCGLVLLTVIVQHPDFPSNMFDVQGLNPWNAVLAAVIFGFVINRANEPGGAPPSRLALGVLAAYVTMVIGCGVAALGDFGRYYGKSPTTGGFLVDACVNPLKYVAVGVLFFSGRAHANVCGWHCSAPLEAGCSTRSWFTRRFTCVCSRSTFATHGD
jgi:hypothetical protein